MTTSALVILAASSAGLAVWLRWPRTSPAPASRALGRLHSPTGTLLSRLRPSKEPPVGELLAGLAAELAAGQPTGVALEQAAAGLVPPPCPRALRAVRMGGDVAAALRRDGVESGVAGLAALAACWEVAEHSGAGLSAAVARLADGLRASELARAQLTSELAAVRTSARMLAALPVFGLVTGQWIGAHPLAWLLGGWWGRLVLLLGAALQAAGLMWLRRLVAGVREGL
ncbi:MAG: hypothetical protein WCF04_12865 [Candidatus Nanopelagicales bacterium]